MTEGPKKSPQDVTRSSIRLQNASQMVAVARSIGGDRSSKAHAAYEILAFSPSSSAIADRLMDRHAAAGPRRRGGRILMDNS
jgi:hypothetical protein